MEKMKLGLMQLKNSFVGVPQISAKYGVNLIERVSCSTDGVNVPLINAATEKLNVNLFWKSGAEHITMPVDIEQYKKDFINGYYSKLIKPPYLTAIQNEAVAWNQNYTPEMMMKMVKFHVAKNPDNLITHSGTPMPICAGITRRYLMEIGATIRLQKFDEQWAGSSLWVATDDKVDLALKEMKLLNNAQLTNFVYTIHFNARSTNIPCIPIILKALRYYNNYEIVVNEMSVYSYEAQVVTDAVTMFKKNDIKTLIGFISASGWAVEWTEEMIAAFCALA